MKRSRGFTLVEGLFSLLLVLVILTGLSRTLENSAKVRANRQNMDRAIEESHLLNAMRAEILASLEVLDPNPGPSNSLRLRMINPQRSFLERIDLANGPNSPFDIQEQVEVRYHLVEHHLVREVREYGGESGSLSDSSRESLTLSPVSRMSIQRDEGLVLLSLTFPYSRVEKTRMMKVELR